MTPATETTEPTNAELARFARTFGLEGSPRVREHYERHQRRRVDWRPSDKEVKQAGEIIVELTGEGVARDEAADRALSRCAIGHPEGLTRHTAAEKLLGYVEALGYLDDGVAAERTMPELEAAFHALQPRVCAGDPKASDELVEVTDALRAAQALKERREAEREKAELAEREEREKAQERAEKKLAPRIVAAKALCDERLAGAAQAVADLHRLQGEQSEALRVADAAAGTIEAARPRPHRVIEAWSYALRLAGLPVRGSSQPFSDAAQPL